MKSKHVNSSRPAGKPNRVRKAVSAALMAAALVAPVVAVAADAPRRPNIVVIVADDMGFADMGAFGSEIRTPNLDALAMNGLRFTNFYPHATSSPTGAILLTGVDNHLNGLGNAALLGGLGEEAFTGQAHGRVRFRL
jgi:hypothetical protein